MLEIIITVGGLTLFLVVAAVIFLCVWALWAAARAVPKPYRMRWPWLIWIFLCPVPLPFIDQLLPLITLLPLARSYRRFFRKNQINGGGDCGLGLVIVYWSLICLDLVYLAKPFGLVPHPGSMLFHVLAKRLPEVTAWARAVGWVILLLLAVKMRFLRRAVLGARPQPTVTDDVRLALEASLPVQARLRRKVTVGILLVLAVLFAVDQWWVRAWRVIPIGHDTTRLTGPIRKGGGINYLAALNQMESRGVTPANNALPLLIEAAGPKCFNTKYGNGKWVMQWVMPQLGMPPFTNKSKSLVTFTRWLKKHPLPLTAKEKTQPTWILESRFENRPWTAKQYPTMAEWINMNQRALRLLAQAIKRPRYYIPLCSRYGQVTSAFRPGQSMVDSLRDLACADAMFLLGKGDTIQALQEARNVHHLAQRVSQSLGFASFFQVIDYEDLSLGLDRALANSGQLSRKQLHQLLEQVQNGERLPPLAEAINFSRYEALENLTQAAHDGLVEEFGSSMLTQLQQGLLPVNYADLMRRTNRLFDAVVAASQIRNFPKQLRQLGLAEQRFRIFSGYEKVGIADTGTIRSLRTYVYGGSDVNGVLRSLFRPLDVVVSEMRPPAVEMDQLREATLMRRRLTELAIALALYRQRQGRYPVTLSPLAPRYVKVIPSNSFTGRPLHYKIDKTDEGFVLYCTQPAYQLSKARRLVVKGGDWVKHAAK